ncbi:MAG: hypothetical protein ACJASB_002782 [Shewanella psychromarinicola]|jgi:hypothetical protein
MLLRHSLKYQLLVNEVNACLLQLVLISRGWLQNPYQDN